MTPSPTERTAHGFTIDFGGWGRDDPDVLAARLFGKMVELGTTVVTEYHSDFYRDAQLLQELMPDILSEAQERGAAELFWAARTYGTILARYHSDYVQAKGILGAVFGYRIIIRYHGWSNFTADFIPDTEPYEALPLAGRTRNHLHAD